MTTVEVRGGPALPQERRLVTEIPGPVSREWTERRLAAVSHAVSVTMPVFAVAAGGGVVVDVDGNSLIDFGSGIAVTTVGNSAPQVVAAVQEQVERFTHTCFMITPYAGYVEVAEELERLTPGDHEKRSALFNSGAEAVENAVKIARLATGRSAVAAFDHAYHGRTNLTMALTAKALPYKLGFGPFAPEVYRAPLSYPFHDGLSGEAAAARAISVLDKQVGATQLAAMIIEPIQGEGGFIVPAPGFLPALSAWCREHGIVFIADEVQSGFARTGAMFACEHEGIVPDLVTTAKGIAGGLPLAGVTGRVEIMNAPHARRRRGHLRRQPGGVRGGARVDPHDPGRRARRAGPGDRVGRGAAAGALAERDRRIGDVRGRGAMLAVELVDPSSGEPEAAAGEGGRRGGARPRADPADLRDLRQRPAAAAAAVDAGPPAGRGPRRPGGGVRHGAPDRVPGRAIHRARMRNFAGASRQFAGASCAFPARRVARRYGGSSRPTRTAPGRPRRSG